MSDKRAILLLSFACFVISFIFLNFYQITLNDIITLPIKMISSVSKGSFHTIPFMHVIFFVLFQVLGFIFLGQYSLNNKDPRKENIVILTSIVTVITGLVFVGINIIYMFFSIGFILSCYFTVLYFPKFNKEFLVWKNFRTGATTIKMVILILSVFVSFGIFLEVSSDNTIEEIFYNDTITALRDSIDVGSDPTQIPGYEDLSEEQKEQVRKSIEQQNQQTSEQIDEMIRNQIDKTPILRAYVNNLALVTSILVLTALLFLRSVASPVGGIISFIVLNVDKRLSNR